MANSAVLSGNTNIALRKARQAVQLWRRLNQGANSAGSSMASMMVMAGFALRTLGCTRSVTVVAPLATLWPASTAEALALRRESGAASPKFRDSDAAYSLTVGRLPNRLYWPDRHLTQTVDPSFQFELSVTPLDVPNAARLLTRSLRRLSPTCVHQPNRATGAYRSNGHQRRVTNAVRW